MRFFNMFASALVLGLFANVSYAASCLMKDDAGTVQTCSDYQGFTAAESTTLEQSCNELDASEDGYDGTWQADACDASLFAYQCAITITNGSESRTIISLMASGAFTEEMATETCDQAGGEFSPL